MVTNAADAPSASSCDMSAKTHAGVAAIGSLGSGLRKVKEGLVRNTAATRPAHKTRALCVRREAFPHNETSTKVEHITS